MLDENKLISLMENFQGQKFQWVKTNKLELLGKVVLCKTIEPRGDRFFAIFNDGSSIDTAQLNTSLMMLHGDMEPLSRAEVESIAGAARPTQKPAPTLSAGPVPPAEVQPQAPLPGQPVQFARAEPSDAVKPNMFEIFNSEPTQLTISLNVKLPEKKLLKMMYASAENKDEFLSELSLYLHKMINNQVIKKSMVDLLAPPMPKPKGQDRPSVNLTEIDESK